MTLDSLVKDVASKEEMSQKKTRKIIGTVFGSIKSAMANEDSVLIPDFARFGTKVKRARTGTNLNTKERVDIPAKIGIKFSASKSLKEAVERELK